MPVAVRITPRKMSRADYEDLIAELGEMGANDPPGRRFHAAYGDDEVHMFEVWDSQAQFDAHGDRLMGLLQGAGIDGGIVEIHPLHSEHPD